MGQMYEMLLDTEEWFTRREEIFRLRGKKCTICNIEDTYSRPLHIHHIKYTGLPWEAPDSDLICLCSLCHRKVHDGIELTNKDCLEAIIRFEENKRIEAEKKAARELRWAMNKDKTKKKIKKTKKKTGSKLEPFTIKL
jgi:hypothetical protein